MRAEVARSTLARRRAFGRHVAVVEAVKNGRAERGEELERGVGLGRAPLPAGRPCDARGARRCRRSRTRRSRSSRSCASSRRRSAAGPPCACRARCGPCRSSGRRAASSIVGPCEADRRDAGEVAARHGDGLAVVNARSSGVHLRRKRAVELAKACQRDATASRGGPHRARSDRATAARSRPRPRSRRRARAAPAAPRRAPRRPRRPRARSSATSERVGEDLRPQARCARRRRPATRARCVAPPASSASWPSAKREGHAFEHRARQLRAGRVVAQAEEHAAARADRCAACARPTGRAGRSARSVVVACALRLGRASCASLSACVSRAQPGAGSWRPTASRSSGARCRAGSGRTRARARSGVGREAVVGDEVARPRCRATGRPSPGADDADAGRAGGVVAARRRRRLPRRRGPSSAATSGRSVPRRLAALDQARHLRRVEPGRGQQAHRDQRRAATSSHSVPAASDMSDTASPVSCSRT